MAAIITKLYNNSNGDPSLTYVDFDQMDSLIRMDVDI